MSEELQRQILIAIRRIVRAIDLYSRELMSRCGLTGPQLAALRELAMCEQVSSHELAQALHISEPTIAGVVDRLLRGGLIKRTRNRKDRRSLLIGITEKGRQMLQEAPGLLQEQFVERLAALESWEQTLILSSLQRVAAMMAAQDLEAAPHLVTGADKL